MSGAAKAFLWSVAAYVLLVIVYLASLRVLVVKDAPVGWLILALLFIAPIASGFVWAWRMQSQRFATVALLAAVCSVCLELANLTLGWLGFPTDIGGISDAPWIIFLSFLVLLPLTAIGAGIGTAARRHVHA